MLGDRLKLARKKAGLSLRALSERIDPHVSAQAISRYETNAMMPSSSVLLGLGKALDVSLDFLMSSQVVELTGIEFRKHSGTSARDRARVEAVVTEQLEHCLAVDDILDLGPEQDPFDDVRPSRVNSLEEAERLAERLRKKWDLGSDPIPSMTALLEDKGIKLVEADLPERVSGMTCCVRRAEGKPDVSAIVVSTRINVERKRFTLAHELGHRVMEEAAVEGVRLEKAIDRFAGAFLVPAGHLRQEAGTERHGVAYQEIKRLKHFYGVSAVAVLLRLQQAGILHEGVTSYAFRTYAQRWRKMEPDPISDNEGFGILEIPQRHERMVFRALAEEMISPARAAELIGKRVDEIEAGLRGPTLA